MPDEKRIWNLRLNLDDFNSEYLKLRCDSDRFQFFLGFHFGCMGGELEESERGKFCDGYRIGFKMFRHAEGLSRANSENAVKSVETRRRKYGTAQPLPSDRSNDRSETARAPTERTPEPNELTTNRRNDESKERRTKFIPPTLDELTAYAKEIGFRDHLKWMNHYTANGWMVGKNKMKDWKACVRNWNLNPIQGAKFGKPGQQPLQFGKEYHESQRIVNADGTF